MTPSSPTGLGEPEAVGKKSLFQPPSISAERNGKKKVLTMVGTRIRMTLEMTKQSLEIVQRYQSQYRLEHGHALPKWKIIGEALVLYDREKKGEGSETKHPSPDQ